LVLGGGIGGWNIAAIRRECTYAQKEAALPTAYHCIEGAIKKQMLFNDNDLQQAQQHVDEAAALVQCFSSS
jgi:hypothetical protein